MCVYIYLCDSLSLEAIGARTKPLELETTKAMEFSGDNRRRDILDHRSR